MMRFSLACLASALIGASLAFLSPIGVTYELQRVDQNGALYILDHGLSADDCRASLATLPLTYGAACVAVPA